MKQLFPILLFAVAPLGGVVAQNKSGLVMSDLDKTVSPATDFYQFATGAGRRAILFLLLIVGMEVLICFRKMSTNRLTLS